MQRGMDYSYSPPKMGLLFSIISQCLVRPLSSKVARWQNLIPSFPWIALPALHPGAIQGKEGIKFCHLATLRGYCMHEGRERWSERERRGWKDTAMSANNCYDGGARARRNVASGRARRPSPPTRKRCTPSRPTLALHTAEFVPNGPAGFYPGICSTLYEVSYCPFSFPMTSIKQNLTLLQYPV